MESKRIFGELLFGGQWQHQLQSYRSTRSDDRNTNRNLEEPDPSQSVSVGGAQAVAINKKGPKVIGTTLDAMSVVRVGPAVEHDGCICSICRRGRDGVESQPIVQNLAPSQSVSVSSAQSIAGGSNCPSVFGMTSVMFCGPEEGRSIEIVIGEEVRRHYHHQNPRCCFFCVRCGAIMRQNFAIPRSSRHVPRGVTWRDDRGIAR